MNENSVFLEQYYLHKRLKEEMRQREEEDLKKNLHLGKKAFYTVVATFFLIGSWVLVQNTIEMINMRMAMNYTATAAVPAETKLVVKTTPEILPSAPNTISIPSLDKQFDLQRPDRKDNKTLNEFLLKGPVYYPDSRKLEEDGNILILGHSSYLPFIGEKYQTFNGVENLKKGEEIILKSADREYVYKVKKVRTVVANEEEIKLKSHKKSLTLSTCNSFGRKDERFVVEAELENSYSLEDKNMGES